VNAFIRFLAFPPFVFDIICELVRAHPDLPASRDPARAVGRRGQTPRFDYIDLTAMALRRFQLNSTKMLEILMIEFGATQSVISRSLSIILPIMADVVKKYVSLFTLKKPSEGRDDAGRVGAYLISRFPSSLSFLQVERSARGISVACSGGYVLARGRLGAAWLTTVGRTSKCNSRTPPRRHVHAGQKARA